MRAASPHTPANPLSGDEPRSEKPMRLVESEPDGIGDIEAVAGAVWPRLADGDYEARLIRYEVTAMRMFRGALRLFARFELVGGSIPPGTQIYGAWPVLSNSKGRMKVKARGDLYIMLCRLLGYRVRPDRISLAPLRACVLKVRTRTVKTNARQRKLPECLQYSVVDDIVEIMAGHENHRDD